jgi:hypothetical protein
MSWACALSAKAHNPLMPKSGNAHFSNNLIILILTWHPVPMSYGQIWCIGD